jgi:hypothetical protein
MKRLFAIIAALCIVGDTAFAVVWQCQMPGGTYNINTLQIVSISTHEYVLNGVARVTELTIGTASHVTARFYYLEPLVSTSSGPLARAQGIIDRVQERANQAVERAGQDRVWMKVTKDYPATTHAHTVEYRVDSKDQIQTIYNSVLAAWRPNTNAVVRLVISPTE